MKTLLNGKGRAIIRQNDTITAEFFTEDSRSAPGVVLRRPSRGWEVRLNDIRPSHLSPHTTSTVADYVFLDWAEQDLLCVAGYKRFFAIRGQSGEIVHALELVFTDKESLDLLTFSINSAKSKLIVVATKVAWLIAENQPRPRKVDIPGLAESVSEENNGFRITFLDTSKAELPKDSVLIS
jgi:hypothetical protein